MANKSKESEFKEKEIYSLSHHSQPQDKDNDLLSKDEPTKFCMRLRKAFEDLIDDCGDDPRSALGIMAIKQSRVNTSTPRGWVPAYDTRGLPEYYE